MKTKEELQAECDDACTLVNALVRTMIDRDVEPAAISQALTAALGVTLAAAPRHMADRLEAATLDSLRAQRQAVWAEIDNAPATH